MTSGKPFPRASRSGIRNSAGQRLIFASYTEAYWEPGNPQPEGAPERRPGSKLDLFIQLARG
jgi:hypothetical protein